MPPLLHSSKAFSIWSVSSVWFPRALTVHVFPFFAGLRGAGPHGLDNAVDTRVATMADLNVDFMAVFDINEAWVYIINQGG